jgi:hypothetical protein
MKRDTIRIPKFDSLYVLLTIGLIIIICFTSSSYKNDDSTKLKIVYKEIKAERKLTDITEKNIKYIDGKNAFHSESYLWSLANILYNSIDLNEIQSTGGKYCTIYGNIDNNFKDFDPYLFASFLTNEELLYQVQWHNSFQITDLTSYKKYYSSLKPEVLARVSGHKDFTIEKQFEKVTELFEFYRKAYENGSWVLIHIDH